MKIGVFLVVSLISYFFEIKLLHADSGRYQIHGVIENISSDEVTVRSDKNQLRFKIEGSGSEIPKNAKVGDQVTVWYTLDIEKISIQKDNSHRDQEPGEVHSRELNDLNEMNDLKNQNIIRDDRVFYSAKNSKGSPRRGLDQG